MDEGGRSRPPDALINLNNTRFFRVAGNSSVPIRRVSSSSDPFGGHTRPPYRAIGRVRSRATEVCKTSIGGPMALTCSCRGGRSGPVGWGHLTKRTIKHANEVTCQVELSEVERSPVRKSEIDPIATRFWRPSDIRLEYPKRTEREVVGVVDPARRGVLRAQRAL